MKTKTEYKLKLEITIKEKTKREVTKIIHDILLKLCECGVVSIEDGYKQD
jgi:hypothetical protein